MPLGNEVKDGMGSSTNAEIDEELARLLDGDLDVEEAVTVVATSTTLDSGLGSVACEEFIVDWPFGD